MSITAGAMAAYSICDAIFEGAELDLAFVMLPLRKERSDKAGRRCFRVGIVVVERYVADFVISSAIAGVGSRHGRLPASVDDAVA